MFAKINRWAVVIPGDREPAGFDLSRTRSHLFSTNPIAIYRIRIYFIPRSLLKIMPDDNARSIGCKRQSSRWWSTSAPEFVRRLVRLPALLSRPGVVCLAITSRCTGTNRAWKARIFVGNLTVNYVNWREKRARRKREGKRTVAIGINMLRSLIINLLFVTVQIKLLFLLF